MSYDVVMELDPSKIRKLLESGGIVRIVNQEFISGFDLTLQYYKSNGKFRLFSPSKIVTLFEVENALNILNDKQLLESYIDILLDPNEKKFLHEENFCFSKDGTKIATKDFRILIDDLNGIIPKAEMLHIASIASLMLGGSIEYPIGYDYISSVMKKYGYTEFTYQDQGYLHISIKENAKYKPPVITNPKS